MKKTIALFSVALLALVFAARAGITVSNVLDNASVNNTTNYGTPVFIGYAYVANVPTMDIYQRGLVNTNAANWILATGIGTNTTNFVVSGSPVYSTTTNAAHVTISGAQLKIPIYATVVTVTTNNVTNSISAIFQTP